MELTAVPCSPVRAEHAEGPFWYEDRLGWVDILVGRLLLAGYDGSALAEPRTYDIGRPLGAAAPAETGGWMLAAGAGFAHLAEDGTMTEIVTLADPDVVRMNDGKCDPAGRFWAGTMGHDAAPGLGECYRVDLDGTVHTVFTKVTISNGLGWSSDRRTMYYIDSPTGSVDTLDYDDETGRVARRRPIAQIEGDGIPDGMTVDDEDCLWVAIWGGGSVLRFAPDGRHIGTVRVAATNVSSCCFGGPDGSTLFITTSRLGIAPDAEPDAGRIFRVEPGVTGRPVTAYRGSPP